MARINDKNIAEAIYLASKGKNEKDTVLILKNTVNFLVKKRLLSRSKNILNHLKNIQNQNEGIIEVKVTSALPIDNSFRNSLKKFIEKVYPSTRVSFLEEQDKNLISGAKIEFLGQVIDFSLKNKIKKLQEHLIVKL